MKYILDYNEKTAKFKITEVGRTVTTLRNENDYKVVGSSDSLVELKTFVMWCNLGEGLALDFKSVFYRFQTMYNNLDVIVFKPGDF